MGVDHVVRSGSRIPNMRDERGTGQLVGFGGELDVFPRGDRLLANLRATPAVKHTEPGPVGVFSALRGKVVRSVQQPKRGGDDAGPGVQPEEPAHQRVSSADNVASDWRA